MSEIVDAASLPVRRNNSALVAEIEKIKVGKALVMTLEEKGVKSRAALSALVGSLRREKKVAVYVRSLTDGRYAIIREKGTVEKKTAEPTVA